MLMLISPMQGPKVLTNKHKPLASLRGTGGYYEYFCPPSHCSVWKWRNAIVLLFYYTYLLTQWRLKPPGGWAGGVLLTVKRQQAVHLLVTRMCTNVKRNGGMHIAAGSILNSAETQPSQASPQICIYSLACFTQPLHSLFHLHLQHQATVTYWIFSKSPEFCIILGPGCIWYCQLARLNKSEK